MGLCGNFTRRITNEILGVRGLHNNNNKKTGEKKNYHDTAGV